MFGFFCLHQTLAIRYNLPIQMSHKHTYWVGAGGGAVYWVRARLPVCTRACICDVCIGIEFQRISEWLI